MNFSTVINTKSRHQLSIYIMVDSVLTRTVDVHVDGFLTTFRLKKQELGHHQT